MRPIVLRTILSGVAAVCTALWLTGCVSQAKAPVVDHSVPRGATPASTPPDAYVVRPKDTLYSIAFRHEMDYRALAAANGIEPPYLIKPGQRIRLAAATSPAEAAPRPSSQTRPERTVPRATPVRIAPSGLSVEPDPPPAPATTLPKTPSAPKTSAPSSPPAAPKKPSAAKPTPPKPAPTAPAPAKPTPPKPAPPPPPPSRAKPPAAAKTPAAAKAGWRRPVAAKPVRRFGAGSKGFDYELPPATRIRAATAGVVVYAGPGIGGFRHLVIVKASERHLVAYGVNVQPLLSEGDEVPAGAPVAEVQGDGKNVGRFHFEIRDGGKPVDPGPLIGV